MSGPSMKLPEKIRERHGPKNFGRFNALVKLVIQRVAKASRASPTKPARPNKRSKSAQARRKTGPARR